MKYPLSLTCALALAACGQAAETTAPPTTEPAATQISRVALQPLAGAPIDEVLTGELRCSFSAGGDMLVLAAGNVDDTARSQAVVMRDGAVMALEATEVGGYDGMVERAMFAGGGLTVEVLPGAEAETGTEQVAHAATLRARSGGQEQSYAGVWTCGP